jgi:hypothetical protein
LKILHSPNETENPALTQKNTVQIPFCLVSPDKMRKSHKLWNKMEHEHKDPNPSYLILAYFIRNLSINIEHFLEKTYNEKIEYHT